MLELVIGRDQMRRDFSAQCPDKIAKLYPLVFAPSMSQIPFNFIQLNQFGGRPVHGLLFLFWQLQFPAVPPEFPPADLKKRQTFRGGEGQPGQVQNHPAMLLLQ